MRKRLESWVAPGEFWKKAEPLVPKQQRGSTKEYKRKAGSGRKSKNAQLVPSLIVYLLLTGCQ